MCRETLGTQQNMADQVHSFLYNTFYKNMEAGICEIVRIF